MQEEIASLPALVERDLANATVAGLADDWKFNIAYYAALQAALAATGFRAAREAQEMHEPAAALRDDVLGWLCKQHPKLLK
jgi:hypothetical protein